MTSIKTIKTCFNKAEDSYDEHCYLQRHSGKKLISLLPETSTSSNKILDAGCGTGLITQQLALVYPYQDFLAIDIADRLLAIADNRLKHLGIITQLADFQTLSYKDRAFSLIFSNMALHWSQDIEASFLSLYNVLHENGVFAFSIPLIGSLHELQPYVVINSFFSSAEIKSKLQNISYKIITTHVEKTILKFKNTRMTLQSIKRIGANFTGKKPQPGLCGKSFLQKANLQKLTYHIGYFVAQKVSSRGRCKVC